MFDPPPAEFLALSADCGDDPLQVQGPGGNTSFKRGEIMWIKASGTELADAERKPIFVAVDRVAARAEALGAGDGTCKATVLDPGETLRPSIETTFHALLDWEVVVHTHSVATLAHAISPEGVEAAREKLAGLPFAIVPYRKPGLELTTAIREQMKPETRVFLLRNHGLIVAGRSVREAREMLVEVERRLALPARHGETQTPQVDPPAGHTWHSGATLLATDPHLCAIAGNGSYYPDHVVFLGPALAQRAGPDSPAVLVPKHGVALRADAKPVAGVMLQCLADVLRRLPDGWSVAPIGEAAEAELLDWDAEKYRQTLADRQG